MEFSTICLSNSNIVYKLAQNEGEENDNFLITTPQHDTNRTSQKSKAEAKKGS